MAIEPYWPMAPKHWRMARDLMWARRFARKLRALVGQEVPRRPMAVDRRVEEGHEVPGAVGCFG
jgi:hypothetical protein